MTTDLSPSHEMPSEALPSVMPEGLPEKFWDPKAGEVRMGALIKSYLELERRLSHKDAVRAAYSCPETPDAYAIDAAHGLFAVDPEVNRRLHEKGLTQEQVQCVYDLAAERFVPMVSEFLRDAQADREVERLIGEFGGADSWREVSRQLLAFGRKNLAPDTLTALASSCAGVKALYRMMQAEQPTLGQGDGIDPADPASVFAMMRNPKYWRDRDPAFIAKVTAGFEQLYR